MAHPRLSLRAGVIALACALLAVTAAALLAQGPVLAPLRAVGAGAGAIAVVGLGIGLAWGRGVAVPAAVALVAVDYALVLLGAPRAAAAATAAAPLVAGAVFLSAELGWWAVELRRSAREAPSALLRRGAVIGVVTALAVGLAEGCLLAAGGAVSGGVAPTAIGVAAAGLLLGMAAWLAARSAAQT